MNITNTSALEFSPGVAKGIKVLELQNGLMQWGLSSSERQKLNRKIAEIFEKTQSYAEMVDLRNTIDEVNTGSSKLHQLVYNDVDIATSHRIIRSINKAYIKAYKEDPSQIQTRNMIFSDVDDTIQPSLNDRNSINSKFYPSALAFYNELGKTSSKKLPQQISLTFLSARPHCLSALWNKLMVNNLPEGTKFFSLYGSSTTFLCGVRLYLIKIFAYLANQVLCGTLKGRVKKLLDSSESNTLISIALEKRRNIDRDLLLRPEVRPIMVGDCGEGDLLFLLTKNSGVPSPMDDERIPNEYWNAPKGTLGNPTNKPLYLSFAHALTSQTEKYEVKPDPSYRKEYKKELNVVIFDNYVDNALYCYKKRIFDKQAANRVVADSKAWLSENKKIHKALFKKYHIAKTTSPTDEKLKSLPALKYILKLSNSIESYENYVKMREMRLKRNQRRHFRGA